MKNWKCALAAVVVLAFAGLAVAQPTIGVYFDEEGTVTDHLGEIVPGMNTGYVYVKDAGMVIGGAAFSVDIDPTLSYMMNIDTELGIYVGDENGLEVGLYTFIPVFDPDDCALLCTFSFYSFTQVLNAEITVGTHPSYDAPKVADNSSVQHDAIGLTSYLDLRPVPTIGVYWDEEGTVTHADYNGGLGETHHAWILVKNAEMVIGGATFKLVLDPLIMLGMATPADGLVFGSLTSGVEMGLYTYIPVFGSDAGLLYSIDLITFDNLMEDAPLEIVNHPNYDAPKVADNFATQYSADGLTSFLTIAVGNETKAWGEVKDLYR